MVSSKVDFGENFFFHRIFSILAPKRKPTKFQLEMATSMDDLKATMESMAMLRKAAKDTGSEREETDGVLARIGREDENIIEN